VLTRTTGGINMNLLSAPCMKFVCLIIQCFIRFIFIELRVNAAKENNSNQQFKHFSRRPNMGPEIRWNL